jgi:hypothetical protein
MKAPKITFFMLVTNRDVLIADYAAKRRIMDIRIEEISNGLCCYR